MLAREEKQTGTDPRRAQLHSSIRAPPTSMSVGRKVATGFLAVSIILVMIVWFSFLGWGAVAFVRWFVDSIAAFWLR